MIILVQRRVRDVSFAEDRCQVRTGRGPQVMAALRNLTLTALRRPLITLSDHVTTVPGPGVPPMDNRSRRGHPRIPPAQISSDIDVYPSEEPVMAGLIRKSLDSPEETRPFEEGKGKLELVNVEGGPVGRATFEPGWQWSKHVKPIAGTESCQAAHMAYFVSGRMKVVMDDGEEMDYGPGDFAIMAPGHDAWTVGDEACVVIDWQGFADYAKR
jgi:quercetin dioxygenase-like cupin family protein